MKRFPVWALVLLPISAWPQDYVSITDTAPQTMAGQLNTPNLNNFVYASQYPGANGGIQINNAVTSVGISSPADVIASPGQSVGVYGATPNNVAVWDYRATQDLLGNVTGTEWGTRLPTALVTQVLGDFSTNSLTGTVTMTNGSTAVTGVGTSFTTQINPAMFFGPTIKMSVDSSTSWGQVCSVASDTSATLCSNYAGSGAADSQ